MSAVAHFFMAVSGSFIHERMAQLFVDFYSPVRGSSGRKGQSAPNIPDPKFVSLIQFKVCLLLI